MCSVALVQLGLSKSEFFELTPRDYTALTDQHKFRTRHTELLTAIVAASIVNTGVCAPEKPLPFTHFMPSEWAKQAAKKPRKKRVTKGEREFINSKIRGFMLARETRG